MSGLLDDLIESLTILPGIGRKSASRIAFYLLKLPRQKVEELASTIVTSRLNLKPCARCGNLTESELCHICTDSKRDNHIVCVVEESSDVVVIENTSEYRGVYHVTGGALSPLDGIGPDDINLAMLEKRVKDDGITEVILATNPNTEGEATAAFIINLLRPYNIKITRIARGIPVGGFLEYADKTTLSKALENRTEVK